MSAFGLSEGTAILDRVIRLHIVGKDAGLCVGHVERLLIRAQHDAVGALNVVRNAHEFPVPTEIVDSLTRPLGEIDAVAFVDDDVA